MITIIDYGMGNIHSIVSIIEYLDERCVVSRDPAIIADAEKLILPGVGAFRAAMQNLEQYQLSEVIRQQVANGTPILGICLGMQILGCHSSEQQRTEGFGLISGELQRFQADENDESQKIPHVGFNEIEILSDSLLFDGLPASPIFYFTHSYRMQCQLESEVSSYAVNGERFVASVEKGNLFGTQFHPELSQDNGIKLMSNFIHKV